MDLAYYQLIKLFSYLQAMGGAYDFDSAIAQLVFFEKQSSSSGNWNALLDIGPNFQIAITGRIKVIFEKFSSVSSSLPQIEKLEFIYLFNREVMFLSCLSLSVCLCVHSGCNF